MAPQIGSIGAHGFVGHDGGPCACPSALPLPRGHSVVHGNILCADCSRRECAEYGSILCAHGLSIIAFCLMIRVLRHG